MGVQLPSEPITRKEQYLAKAAGQAVEIPTEPITREEAYLNAIAHGGGGGGTSDYNQLENQPQIGGVTLTGNKSASDLGLANADDVKVKDVKVDNASCVDSNGNAIVAIQKSTGTYSYEISTYDYSNTKIVTKHDGVVTDTTIISYETAYAKQTIDDRFTLQYVNAEPAWTIELLIDSKDAPAGTKYQWNYAQNPPISDIDFQAGSVQVQLSAAYEELNNSIKDNRTAINEIKDGQTIDSFGDVETALSNKQDTLTFDNAPTENSNNPVKSGGVYSALALKQNATDNSLDTEAKTIVGAINEHEGDIGSLRSGLTNLDNEVNGDAVTYPYADVITVSDAVPANLKGCSVKIEPVQSGTGTPSPENVRPITGHTECVVTVKDDAIAPSVTNTYTIALGDTIYGGTVDFDSGVMTVDRQYLYVDGSDTTILNVVNGQLQIAISSTSKTNTDLYHKVGDLVCNCFEEIYSNSQSDNGIYYRANGSHNLLVRGYGYTAETTLADWVQWLSAEPLQIVYGLETPFTIQLTPQQIQLLQGTNTLYASTGDISVTVNGVSGAIGSVQEQVNELTEIKLIQGEISGTTDSNGMLTPAEPIDASLYAVVTAYDFGSHIIIPFVASSDSTWRFKVLAANMQPMDSESVTIKYMYTKTT